MTGPGPRYDELTGLPARRLCLERLASAAAGLRRTGEPGLAVLLVELDGFAGRVDELGPESADEVLVAVADRLRRAVRPGDLVARVGADRFVLLAQPIGGLQGAEALAERAAEAVRAPVQVGPRAVRLTASTGIALAVAGDAPEALLEEAGAALGRAQAGGGDRHEVADDAVRARARRRSDLEDDLRRALATGALGVAFQPEVDVATGQVAAFEALVRWGHPEHGAVPPQELVALAEDTGLIRSLGVAVARSALAACARWHAAGHEVPVAVNLSGRQLDDPGLADELLAMLRAAGVAPGWVVAEVTETALQDPGPAALATVERLRSAGCAVALDDFGTGSSSLAALRALPVDYVKVDRRFLVGFPADPTAVAVVAAVTQLAHALGMRVVAEGVEDAPQLAALRDLGCDLVQGFHVGAPVDEAGALALLAR